MAASSDLEPLTLTRPAYELICWGLVAGGSKIARAAGIGPGPARRGAVIRPWLAAIQQQRDPHTIVNDRELAGQGAGPRRQ